MCQMFQRRLLAWLSALLVLVAVGAACGGDDGENQSPTAATTTEAATTAGDNGGATDVGVTATSIKVGSPSYYSGAVGVHGTAYARGWEACYRRINDSGGINGRKIEWVSDDTEFDPTRANAIATKLVTQDKVFAVVATQDALFNGAADKYLQDQGVPNIGPDGLGSDEFTFTQTYPIGSLTVNSGHLSAEFAAKKAGMTKIAVVSLQLGAANTRFNQGAEEVFKQLGGSVAFTQEIPVDFQDHGAIISRASSEGVDGIIFNGDIGNFTGFVEAAANQGWSPAKGWIAFGPNDFIADLEKQKDIAPKIYAVYLFDTIYMQNPSKEIGLFKDTLAKYFPGEEPALFTYHAWVGCRLFEALVNKVGPNLTRKALLDAIDNLSNYDTGMGPKFTWKDDPSKVVNKGIAIVSVIDGKVTQAQDWKEDPYFTTP